MSNAKRGVKGRVSRGDWRHAAMSEIAVSGVKKLSIEKLARQLKVAKSSFYWHYKNRDALLMSCLRSWARFVVDDFEDSILSRDLTGREALIEGTLIVLSAKFPAVTPGGALELAFKKWGNEDDRVKSAVRKVFRRRLELVANFYRQMGLEKRPANDWATLWLSFMTGQSIVSDVLGKKDIRKRFDFAVEVLITQAADAVHTVESKTRRRRKEA